MISTTSERIIILGSGMAGLTTGLDLAAVSLACREAKLTVLATCYSLALVLLYLHCRVLYSGHAAL